jgi:hypothetical protein
VTIVSWQYCIDRLLGLNQSNQSKSISNGVAPYIECVEPRVTTYRSGRLSSYVVKKEEKPTRMTLQGYDGWTARHSPAVVTDRWMLIQSMIDSEEMQHPCVSVKEFSVDTVKVVPHEFVG